MIGYSLSFCVLDILNGKVKESDVEMIYTGTRAVCYQDFERVLTDYASRYWREKPAQGRMIARRLMRAGKIKQPRVMSLRPPMVGNGHWDIDPGYDIAAAVAQVERERQTSQV